jgi:hypothetical protein
MMTPEEIQEKRAALADILLELRNNQGWLFILDQILDMRAAAIEDCAMASRDNRSNFAERKVMRAAMRIDAVDNLLEIIRENIELGITEEEQQALGIRL